MSIGMLEAMARGRSVVAADVPGASEALDDLSGKLIPPEDPAALAAALGSRLCHLAKAGAEGRAARQHVERTYPLHATTESVAELYHDLLSSSREPSAL